MFSALHIHIFFGVREVSYNSIQLFFQGLLFEAKVYSYINNIPTTCFSKGKRAVNCRLQRKSALCNGCFVEFLTRQLCNSVVNSRQKFNHSVKTMDMCFHACSSIKMNDLCLQIFAPFTIYYVS